jgi:hypothetical protein
MVLSPTLLMLYAELLKLGHIQCILRMLGQFNSYYVLIQLPTKRSATCISNPTPYFDRVMHKIIYIYIYRNVP